MKDIYDTLEFNQIKKRISEYCASDLAKEQVLKIMPFSDYDDLLLEQKYLDQAIRLVYKYGRLPIGSFVDIKPYLNKANKDGTLFGDEFVAIVYLLNNVKEIKEYLDDKELDDDELFQFCQQLILPKQLLDSINR